MTTTNSSENGTWNEGDYGYWKDAGKILDLDGNAVIPRRELYTTAPGMRDVIFPGHETYEGDIVPLDKQNYAYYWWREGKDELAMEEFGDLRLKGYDFATTDKFKLVYPGWFEGPGGRITNGIRVLLAVPKERYIQNEEEKRRYMIRTGRLEDIDGEFSEKVARVAKETGVAFEPIDVVSPPKKKGLFSR
jgi:hypothetical protein